MVCSPLHSPSTMWVPLYKHNIYMWKPHTWSKHLQFFRDHMKLRRRMVSLSTLWTRGRCCMSTGHDGGSGTSISPWTTFESTWGRRLPSTLRGWVSVGPIESGVSVFKILCYIINIFRVLHRMATARCTGGPVGVHVRTIHNALQPASCRSVQ
jgi:hypothetical protein